MRNPPGHITSWNVSDSSVWSMLLDTNGFHWRWPASRTTRPVGRDFSCPEGLTGFADTTPSITIASLDVEQRTMNWILYVSYMQFYASYMYCIWFYASYTYCICNFMHRICFVYAILSIIYVLYMQFYASYMYCTCNFMHRRCIVYAILCIVYVLYMQFYASYMYCIIIIIIISSWCRQFGGDGYELMTSIVLGPLSSPLLPSMSVQLIRCPPLYCLSTVVWVCLGFFFLRIWHIVLCVEISQLSFFLYIQTIRVFLDDFV